MSPEDNATISWTERLRCSAGQVVFGGSLAAAMAALLFWNEGEAVQSARARAEGVGAITTVAAAAIDPANQGRLVHVSGTVTTRHAVTDSAFGVSAAGLRLTRRVEMYQWVEKQRVEYQPAPDGSETGHTRYTYAPQWIEQQVDSARFHDAASHTNPPMTIVRQSFSPDRVALGAWSLDATVIERIGGALPFPLPAAQRVAVQRAIGSKQRANIVDGRIHLGADPAQPRIGDYRISYQYLPPGPISVTGRQDGNGIAAYTTPDGGSLLIANTGTVAARDMINATGNSNLPVIWALRLLGIALLIVGFLALLQPIMTAGSAPPPAFGIYPAASLAGMALGMLTMASAWLRYCPPVALAIFTAGVLLAGVLTALARGRKGPARDIPQPR